MAWIVRHVSNWIASCEICFAVWHGADGFKPIGLGFT
jgi:hypothetical protein